MKSNESVFKILSNGVRRKFDSKTIEAMVELAVCYHYPIPPTHAQQPHGPNPAVQHNNSSTIVAPLPAAVSERLTNSRSRTLAASYITAGPDPTNVRAHSKAEPHCPGPAPRLPPSAVHGSRVTKDGTQCSRTRTVGTLQRPGTGSGLTSGRTHGTVGSQRPRLRPPPPLPPTVHDSRIMSGACGAC